MFSFIIREFSFGEQPKIGMAAINCMPDSMNFRLFICLFFNNYAFYFLLFDGYLLSLQFLESNTSFPKKKFRILFLSRSFIFILKIKITKELQTVELYGI